MTSDNNMNKALLRGVASENGVSEHFDEYVKQFKCKFEGLENEEKKAAFLLAVSYFVLDQQ